mmetsp:Transcript_54989/g.160476  ORF Transcript_54989/g.160476 Transcript_54989/m.160476 type:complete len:314 (-) Transcript_54989:121-1062(-)
MVSGPVVEAARPGPEEVVGEAPCDTCAVSPRKPTAASPSKPATGSPRKFLRRGSGRGAAGTQQPSQRPDVACGGLLAFLRGTGTDLYGRRLEEILEWDFGQMERVHNYIQWIFPTDEPSHYNARAPVLTPELQRAVRDEPELRAALGRSLRRFCAFLGLEVAEAAGGSGLSVRAGPGFGERAEVCWRTRGRGNHNWLRISRVLHCLRLAGMDEEAAALLACLEELHDEGVRCGAALLHWRSRAATMPAWRRCPSSEGQPAEAAAETGEAARERAAAQEGAEAAEKAVAAEAPLPFAACFSGIWRLLFVQAHAK